MLIHTLESAVKEGRIDKSHHDRLLAGLDGYTEKAGISPAHVFAPSMIVGTLASDSMAGRNDGTDGWRLA